MQFQKLGDNLALTWGTDGDAVTLGWPLIFEANLGKRAWVYAVRTSGQFSVGGNQISYLVNLDNRVYYVAGTSRDIYCSQEAPYSQLGSFTQEVITEGLITEFCESQGQDYAYWTRERTKDSSIVGFALTRGSSVLWSLTSFTLTNTLMEAKDWRLRGSQYRLTPFPFPQ